eukprot:2428143-Amphidinium_carterae.1
MAFQSPWTLVIGRMHRPFVNSISSPHFKVAAVGCSVHIQPLRLSAAFSWLCVPVKHNLMDNGTSKTRGQELVHHMPPHLYRKWRLAPRLRTRSYTDGRPDWPDTGACSACTAKARTKRNNNTFVTTSATYHSKLKSISTN